MIYVDGWVEFSIRTLLGTNIISPTKSLKRWCFSFFLKAGYVSSLDFTSGWFCQNYTYKPFNLDLSGWLEYLNLQDSQASGTGLTSLICLGAWRLWWHRCFRKSRLLRQSSELFNCWNEWFNVVLVNRQGVIWNFSPSIPKRFKRKLGNVSQFSMALWRW